MSLKCRIFRDEKGQIDFVTAPNGNRSKLFDNLVDITGGNKNTALNIYALTEVEELKDAVNNRLNALKERFKNTVKIALTTAESTNNIMFSKVADTSNYFSNALTAIENLKDKNPKNAVGWIKQLTDVVKNGGIKNVGQELEWIGLEDFLTNYAKDNNTKAGNIPFDVVNDYIQSNQIEVVDVSKGGFKERDRIKNLRNQAQKEGNYDLVAYYDEEVLPFLRGEPVKYEGYQLKGGENYREVLLTIPSLSLNTIQKTFPDGGVGYIVIDSNGNQISRRYESKEEADNFKNNEAKGIQQGYKSSHWDESNILAHVRLNEKTLPDGRRVLIVNEIQSDWAQEGRREGFMDRKMQMKSNIASAKYEALQGELAKIKEEKKADKDTYQQVIYNEGKGYTTNIDGDGNVTIAKAVNTFGKPLGDSTGVEVIKEDNGSYRIYVDGELSGQNNYYGSKEVATRNIEEKANKVDFNKSLENTVEIENLTNPEQEAFKVIQDYYSKVVPLEKQIYAAKKDISDNSQTGLQEMPYKNTDQWVGLATRRVLQMAAQEGYDGVAFATGEQSSDMYSLAKQVDYISTDVTPMGRYINISPSSGMITVQVDDKGIITYQSGSTSFGSFIGKHLSDIIGKDLAEKIINSPDGTKLEGVDLEVGGEGMKSFYNQIVPKVAQKEAQRFDKNAKIGEVDFNPNQELTLVNKSLDKDFPDFSWVDAYGEVIQGGFETEEKALKNKPKVSTYTEKTTLSRQPFIPITDKMRSELGKAIPLFSKTQGQKAQIEVLDQVTDRLKQSGLAKNVYKISNNEIEAKLKEIGKDNVGMTAAGFTYKGDVYLNSEVMGLDTPIHEFGHLHLDWLKENRNDLYQAGLSLISKNKEEAKQYIGIVKSTQPDLKEGTEKFNNEVLAQVIGDQGAKLIQSKKEQSIADWLKSVWDSIKEALGLTKYTADQVANMTLAEFGTASAKELLSGNKVSNTYTKPEFKGNSDIDRLKNLEVEGNEDGATFNLDGSTYTGGGLVVPAISINTTQENLSKEAIESFIKDNEDKIGADSVKVGLYKFKDSDQVSIDLNIVVKPEYKNIALAFGKFAGQESLFNLDNYENIPTGADGKNPKNFTSEEFKQISESLSKGEFPEVMRISPDNSSNYANLTEDGKGNFVFFHVGGRGYENIKRNSGGTTATSREEAAALSKVGGLAMYYTKPEDGEVMVKGDTKYAVKVPMDKVYDFNSDVLGLVEKAKELHDKEHPGKAFDANTQLAYVTKLAGEAGYQMVVSQWKDITRAQTTSEFAPNDIQELEGDAIKKPFSEDYTSNTTKGYKSVVPVSKEDKLYDLYTRIHQVRNAANKYDGLYRLYYEYGSKSTEEISDLINNSDIPQELKDEYTKILNSPDENRRSIRPDEDINFQKVQRKPALEMNGVKIFAKERVNPVTGEKLDGIEWELIESSEKGKGNARKAAEAFLQGTDAQGKDVYLTISPRDKATSPQRLEEFYSSLGFKKTSDFEMMRTAKPVSLKDMDSNGEPSIKTLMDFSNSKAKPLGLEGIKAAKNAAMSLKVKSSKELVEKMEKALMKNGIVLFDKLSLQRSKLYNTFEINRILSSPKLQKQIKESLLSLKNSEPFDLEYDENFIVPTGAEVNQFGKQEVMNPNTVENDLMQSVAGAKESDIEEALPESLSNKYYTDSEFRNTVDSIAKDYKKAPVKTISGDQIVDKTEDVEGMLKNTLTNDVNESISEDIRFLREDIGEKVFDENLVKVSKVLNKIKKNAYVNGIDLRNLPTLALEMSRAEILGFLDSMEDAIADPNNEEDFKDFSDRYQKLLGDNETKTEVIKTTSENDVFVEEPLSEYDMFSKFGLIKKEDGIYRQTSTDDDLDTLYENFFENKNLLPDGVETLEDLKKNVQNNLGNLGVSDFEVDVDNLEKMYLYKKFFGFPMSTQKARVNVDNFNKLTNTEDYLTGDFIKEFNKWLLATSNPYFKVTSKGIELVETDDLSKQEAVDSVPIRFKQDLAEYNIISKNLNLELPLEEEKYRDIDTQLEQRQKAVNNPDRVKKVTGQYSYLKDGVLAVKNESETFVRTPIGIFEKIFEFGNIKFYGKLNTETKQGYKNVSVEAPFSNIDFNEYTYLINSPEAFKNSKNYYSRKELNDINDEYFGCQ